jgi:hypothetical protein
MSSCQQCCVLANQYRTAGARASERARARERRVLAGCWSSPFSPPKNSAGAAAAGPEQANSISFSSAAAHSSIYIKRNPSGRRFFITHRMQTRGYFLHDLIPTPWPCAQFTAAVNFGEASARLSAVSLSRRAAFKATQSVKIRRAHIRTGERKELKFIKESPFYRLNKKSLLPVCAQDHSTLHIHALASQRRQ